MKLEGVQENSQLALSSLSLTPGRDKTGQPERTHIHFKPGEITALLGPTGAGKSRLLADIESLAAGDTPLAALLQRRVATVESGGAPELGSGLR